MVFLARKHIQKNKTLTEANSISLESWSEDKQLSNVLKRKT